MKFKIFHIFFFIFIVLIIQAKQNENPLIDAIKNQNKRLVIKLIKSGEDINQKDNNNWTPLMHAAWIGDSEIVNILIKNKVNTELSKNNGWSLLMIYAGSGNIKEIKKKLKSENINYQSYDGKTALMLAAKNNQIKAIQFLLEQKVDINLTDNNGKNALHYSVYGNHLKVVQILVDNGIDVNSQDKFENTALINLLITNKEPDLSIFSYLLSKGADPYLIDNKGLSAYFYIFSYLMKDKKNTVNLEKEYTYIDNMSLNDIIVSAVRRGNIIEIKELIQNGADVNARDGSGDTILMIACFNENINIIKLLLENGANVNLKNKGKFRYYSNEYDAVILVRENRLKEEIIDILLRYNYNNKNYNLQRAVEKGDLEKVKKLIKTIDDINSVYIEHNAYEPITLLMIACYYGHQEIVKLLIENDADVNATTDYTGAEDNPLSYAIEKNHFNIVKLLIENGADVNSRCYYSPEGNEYSNVLQLACYKNYKNIITLLLDKGANINDHEGYITPLLVAVKSNNKELVNFLIKEGANPNIQFLDYEIFEKRKKITLLMYVVWKENIDLLNLLIDKGADVNIINESGDTALSIALKKRNTNVINILKNAGAK